MKNLIKFIFLMFVITISKISIAQPSFNPLTDCNMPSVMSAGSSSGVIGGLYKPHRTDLSGGIPSDPTARLNVLIVFVQFANESIVSSEWPIDGEPTYMDEIIAENKETSGDYWDRYDQNTELLSDWFQEVSKGRMHITGKAYNIVLDNCDSCYSQATNGMTIMNNEIYQKLESLGTIEWDEYDLWRQGSANTFYYEPDKNIDMIIKVHRHRGNTGGFFNGSGGYAYLGGDEYSVIQGTDTLIINPNSGTHGSGLTIFGSAGGPTTEFFWYGVVRHEYGHYLFGGGHNHYGIMGAGDIFLSQYEIIKLGYQTPQTVDYDYKDYSLLDYSSRTSSGEVLIVPINMPDEFFLIN